MEQNRFRSTVKWLGAFSDKIIVHCPNCNSKAQLLRRWAEYRKYNDPYDFQCNHCHTEVRELEKHIYSINRNCPFCAEIMTYKSAPTTKIKKEIEVSCDQCQKKLCYPPKIEIIKEWISKGKTVELHYWYETKYKGEWFWALNEEHLEYLEQFIASKLRERSLYRSGMMLVDKLPQFIKDKKNRDSLLKTISKLKEK
ncbi:hypothetical protein [Aquimarina sp. MMG016]|uniref:hypothetical protein n=1 Tax=Aquimarina sp. MMG016 TaxID=2822690 RepID=UPI001B3A2118|nr:hypothetical protein [Aquimarina sp. MMG016]MBQ4820727.1 hypothetical protein [Aquimarina sp. MMG016]